MAFILRVRLDSPSDEISSTVLDALKIMAGLQVEHTGLITYHFTRPDPKRPNHFEFTEVYGNEATFFAHAGHSDFITAWYKGFDPAYKLQSVTYGYGSGLVGKVKETCDAVLKCRYPQSTVGFVLNQQKWDMKTTSGEAEDKAVMVIARIRAKEGKTGEILQLLSQLSEDANNGVLVCHGSIPEEEKEPNSIELIELCSTNSHLVSHFGSDKGKEVFKAVTQAAECINFEGYGSVLPSTVQLFGAELGLELVTMATDAGYVLHSQADPGGKQTL